MKKTILLSIAVRALVSFRTATSIYSISFQSISNATVSMTTFQSKKIIIAVFNPAAPDVVFLKALDSIAMQNNTIKIIAIPAKEWGSGSVSSLNSLAQSFSPAVVMTKPINVKKNAGANQHPLFKWLTNYNENGHFDADVEEANQVFVVNATGKLYAVLQQTNAETIKQIANQTVIH